MTYASHLKTIAFYQEEKWDKASAVILTLHGENERDTPNEILSRLTQALTDWAIETPEGLEAWRATASDFNAMDYVLAMENHADAIIPFLARHGLKEHHVDVYQNTEEMISLGGLPTQPLGKVLMDESRIPDEG